ncbi:MAG TPA: hypothetical protein VMB73_12820 [Acetobacteraceae bacterium]|jgi:hypothetical protein|nr:hypothetical protein [Acetobacteraceae bacterium]
MPNVPADYDQNVFINCPFDGDYQPIFKALVFATFECGLRPRCALEIYDAGEVRIGKIARIIRECHWGIHDISRTEPNPSGLPRFNMPLELGIFLGARWFGDRSQKRKSCLILDVDRYRYQQYISDIAGQDIEAHRGDTKGAIKAVRDWLGASRAGLRPPPGATAISERFERFMVDLPAICAATEREVGDLTFTEFADAASTWLSRELARLRN